MIIIFGVFFLLSILGYLIEYYSIGDKKKAYSTMVEEIEEENPNQASLETKKETWALVIYSFSITRNF
jgi:hypothetical protein